MRHSLQTEHPRQTWLSLAACSPLSISILPAHWKCCLPNEGAVSRKPLMQRLGFVLLRFSHSLTSECLQSWCHIPDFMPLLLMSPPPFCLCSVMCSGCLLSLRHHCLFTEHALATVKALLLTAALKTALPSSRGSTCGCQIQRASLGQGKGL